MRRRRAATCGLLIIAAVLSGCSRGDRAAAPATTGSGLPSVTPSSTEVGEGPAPTWTLDVEQRQAPSSVTVIGDLAVLGVDHARGFRVVQMSSGRLIWQRAMGRYVIAGNIVVVWRAKERDEDRVEAVDLTTGRTLWRSNRPLRYAVVRRDAVYVNDCRTVTGPVEERDCWTTRRELRSGRPQWRSPGDVGHYTIGAHPPMALASGRYIPLSTERGSRIWAAAETATGRKLRGQIGTHLSGSVFAVGGTLVSFEHMIGEPPCRVRINAVDINTDATRWTSVVHHGEPSDRRCGYLPSRFADADSLIGAGTQFVTRTANGRPQLFDLATGRSVWTGAERGTPVDANERSVLVRPGYNIGPLSLLDLSSGRVLWTAPETSLEVSSRNWRTAVPARLVAVNGVAAGTEIRVFVYDAGTGQRLANIPGSLVGAGEDWVVVQQDDSAQDRVQLKLIRF